MCQLGFLSPFHHLEYRVTSTVLPGWRRTIKQVPPKRKKKEWARAIPLSPPLIFFLRLAGAKKVYQNILGFIVLGTFLVGSGQRGATEWAPSIERWPAEKYHLLLLRYTTECVVPIFSNNWRFGPSATVLWCFVRENIYIPTIYIRSDLNGRFRRKSDLMFDLKNLRPRWTGPTTTGSHDPLHLSDSNSETVCNERHFKTWPEQPWGGGHCYHGQH